MHLIFDTKSIRFPELRDGTDTMIVSEMSGTLAEIGKNGEIKSNKTKVLGKCEVI